MEVVKKITIIAVLIASSAMFSFANGQLSDKEIREMNRNDAIKQHKIMQQEKACSEAQEMAQKYLKFSMEENNQEKQSMYEQRMSAHATYYQAFCKVDHTH